MSKLIGLACVIAEITEERILDIVAFSGLVERRAIWTPPLWWWMFESEPEAIWLCLELYMLLIHHNVFSAISAVSSTYSVIYRPNMLKVICKYQWIWWAFSHRAFSHLRSRFFMPMFVIVTQTHTFLLNKIKLWLEIKCQLKFLPEFMHWPFKISDKNQEFKSNFTKKPYVPLQDL